MFFTKDSSRDVIDTNIDEYGDSFARDTNVKELREIFDSMPNKLGSSFGMDELRTRLDQRHNGLGELPGWMFWGLLLYIDPLANDVELLGHQKTSITAVSLRMKLASTTAQFGGARITSDLKDREITHVVVGDDRDRLRELRKEISLWVSMALWLFGLELTALQTTPSSTTCDGRVDRGKLGRKDIVG